MAQVNCTVGDIEGNIGKIREYMKMVKGCGADLVAFPELTVTGYPPQDLLLEKAFVKSQRKMLFKTIRENSVSIAGVVGFVDYKRGSLYNAAAVFNGSRIVKIVYKTLLPTYDVFDEARYFKPALVNEIKPVLIDLNTVKFKLGVEICEDLWDKKYDVKVTDLLANRGAQLIINISASPFYAGKRFERLKLLREKSRKNRIPMFYVNLVGGQDELVFDGQSMAVDSSGNPIAIGKQFEEDLIIADIDLKTG
ncbi:MAG: nitrilase-related carbon-nitrogen hydrolase, partial [Candidatus Bathyarchaeia archaeon]